MPEQLTRHPEVTLQVLRSAGVRCGEAGDAPAILVQCPAERFCRLPGGELCVYGLADAPRMTQLGTADWRALAGAADAVPSAPKAGDDAAGWLGGGALGLVAGLAIAASHSRWRRRRRRLQGGEPL